MDKKQPEQLIDLSFLRKFCRDDRQKMANYIHMFLESAPEQIESIKKSAGSSNWSGVKKAVHSLKPQLTFIGAGIVAPLIEKIEYSATSGNANSEIPSLIGRLEDMMDRSFNELIQTLVYLS